MESTMSFAVVNFVSAEIRATFRTAKRAYAEAAIANDIAECEEFEVIAYRSAA